MMLDTPAVLGGSVLSPAPGPVLSPAFLAAIERARPIGPEAPFRLWPGWSPTPSPEVVGLRLQGKGVRLTGIAEAPPVGEGRGKRGVITSFSPSSRRRLLEVVASVDPEKLPVFVTLTYGESWPSDHEEWKRHLTVFWKAVRRYLPGASGLWKLEPQKRGAPHYHLLVWGGRLEKEWVARTWARATGDESEKHVKAGTRVESLRSHGGTMFYAAKYVAKVDDEGYALRGVPAEYVDMVRGQWAAVGRWWGLLSRADIPWAPAVERELVPGGPPALVAAAVVQRIRDGHRVLKGKLPLGPESVRARAFVERGEWDSLVRVEAEALASVKVGDGSLRVGQSAGFVRAVCLALSWGSPGS